MSDQKAIESILIADIGSTVCHICLIDMIEGIYRFVAHAETPSTVSNSQDDVMVGLRQGIHQIERISQRRFLDETDELIKPERISGEGIDAFMAISDAAAPLSCAIIGLTDDLSISSARKACATADVRIAQELILGKRRERWDSIHLNALRQTPPDVLIMVGGVDTGPTAPLEGAARVLNTLYSDIDGERRPILIYAGNQEARRPVADAVGDLFDLRVVDNVRPAIESESLAELQRELSRIYSLIRLPQIPGYRRLRRWCNGPVISTHEALGNTFRFVARRNELSQGVLGIDIGGRSTYVGAARGELYQWVTGSQMGTGHGVFGVMRDSELADIERWLPIPLDRQEIIDRIANAHLRPKSVPQSMEDLFIAHALARQASLLTIRRLREQFWQSDDEPDSNLVLPPFDVIMARGGVLSHTPQDGLLALTLLDAIQPVGLTRLVIDWASLWPQLGALAQLVPLAAAQVLERDALHELGAVIAPRGAGREGERALSLRIIYDDDSTIDADIPMGIVQRFPLPLDQEVRVQVQPNRDLDIGLGRRGIGGEARIRGGSLGLIVDTRGRPLQLSHDREHCRAKLQEWLGNMIHDADDNG